MNEGVRLQSAKIILRDYVEEDLEDFRRWNQPGHAWQKMDAPYLRRSKEMAERNAQTLSEHILSGELPHPRRRLAVSLPDSERLIGAVSSVWESPESGWMSIGLSIYDEKRWRQGLGFAALSLWTDYLFRGHQGLRRLDLRTWSGNRALIALAAKAGFQQEACFREARWIEGQYHDALVFGLLRKEWEDSPLRRP